MEQPLAAESVESTETCCCGLDRDFRKWVQWRRPAGSSSSTDRLPWQSGCTVLFLLEMSSYFYFVLESPVLLVMGGVFVVKVLVEIWGQTTPTWLCPGTLCLLLVFTRWDSPQSCPTCLATARKSWTSASWDTRHWPWRSTSGGLLILCTMRCIASGGRQSLRTKGSCTWWGLQPGASTQTTLEISSHTQAGRWQPEPPAH